MPKSAILQIFILNIREWLHLKKREEPVMSSNISALRALAELNKIEAQRNSGVEPQQPENKSKGFSLFGFGFRNQVNPEQIPPEEKHFKA